MKDVLSTFKKRIEELHKALDTLNEKPPRVTTRPDYVFDYQEGRKKYMIDSVKRAVSSLRNAAWDLVELRIVDKANEVAVLNLLLLTSKLSGSEGPGVVRDKLKDIERIAGSLRGKALSPSTLEISAPILPEHIKEEVNADLNEIRRCFEAECYRSCVVLCGRVLETALHRRYFEATGSDLLETSPGLGLGKLIAKLREHNVQFDPGLTQQIHLINQVRVYSVHQKSETFYPSKGQAHAMILYTVDVLKKLF